MDIVDFDTPLGLALASGLNAYLPMLAFALSVRWLHLHTVNPRFTFITQNWFIAALVILTLLDFVADKIPLIDHVWNAIHTVVRSIAGALVALVASSHALPATPITAVTSRSASGVAMVALGTIPVNGVGLLVILTIGGVVAALSHSTRSVARFVSTLASAGFLTVVPSLIENVLVLIVVLLPLCFYRQAHSAGTLRPRARLTLHSYQEHLDQQALADITPAQVATNLSQLGLLSPSCSSAETLRKSNYQ